MKTTLLITFLIVFRYTTIAQFQCELSQELQQEFSSEPIVPMDYCFDISTVQDDCIPVYVRVNLHFFLDDDCQGELAAADYVTEDLLPPNAFSLAENLVDEANAYFETMSANLQSLNYQWNSDYHNAVPSASQCIPMRYVLAGVYIHCNTNAQNVLLSFSELTPFQINGNTEVNVFVTDFVSGNGNGFASNDGNDAVVENFSPGLFNHELGHVFSLLHTFELDGCDDTWDYNWGWDINCDAIDDVFGDKCWNSEPRYPAPPNDLDACNDYCEDHPCCEWSAQNNNLLTYSAWGYNADYSALTRCQVTKALTDISDLMCDYVAGIHEGCPPPNANIGVIPNLTGYMKCPACFYLNASDNESVYILKLLNQNGNVLLESGEVTEEAGKFCIYPRIDKFGYPYWPYGMVAGQTYTIRLKVYNVCGEYDETELNFILPQPCSFIAQEPEEPAKFELKLISPNPATSYVDILFNLYKENKLTIYAFNIATGHSYGNVYQEDHPDQDNQTIQLNISQWTSGNNILIFQVENEIQIENFIKQ